LSTIHLNYSSSNQHSYMTLSLLLNIEYNNYQIESLTLSRGFSISTEIGSLTLLVSNLFRNDATEQHTCNSKNMELITQHVC
jgi:hypothetical protein